MKTLIHYFCILFLSFNAFGQEAWYGLPLNPNSNSTVTDIEMLNGKVYQIYYWYNGSADVIQIDRFNPGLSAWETVGSINSTVINKIKTEKIGSTIYITAYDNSDFHFLKLDNGSSSIDVLTTPYNFANAHSNWEFHAGQNANELYVLFTSGTGPYGVNGLEYVSGTNSWTYISESSTSQDLSIADLQIQSTANDVYFGLYSNVVRSVRFVKGDILTMFPYDGLGINGGVIESNGADWDNSGYVLTGNLNDYMAFYGTEDANNLSYESEIDGNTALDINLAGPTTDYNLSAAYLAKESSPSHGFIMSMFSDDGLGNPNDKLFVIRRDFSQGGSVWDTLADRLLPQGTAMEQDAFKLSIDNQYMHIAAAYTQLGANNVEIKVYNNYPDVIVGSTSSNTGICAGQMNELYNSLEFADSDYDVIKIVSAVSLNAETSNIQVIPFGFYNGTTKFKILGIPSANIDQIAIVYTDGYGTYNLTLDVYQGITTPINLQFISDPVILCSNETQIDLSDKVNYYDQGSFRLNGNDLENSIINATQLNSVASSGILRYIVNVSGCFISTTANYQIVAPPTANVVVNPTSCSQNNGDASVTIVPGASSTTDFYWSTGETTSSISNLSPGAYYVHVIDGNLCKATALASIDAGEITISESITNPSCYGKQDGAVDLTISSSSTYRLIWLTGLEGEDITNLGPGRYEYTYYGDDGCEINRSVDLISPTQIVSNFVAAKPDCAGSNGSILSNVSGGSGVYTYLWNTSETTPNLTNKNQGFYSLEITDNTGCKAKDSLILNDNFAAIISDSILFAACDANNGGINVSLAQHPQGGPVTSIVWTNGETTEDIYNLAVGQYMITVNSDVNCVAQKTYTIGTRPPLRNNICVVSVDTATTTNLVIWEKVETEGISHYNIYRENTNAGEYSLIDTVHYTNLSVFNDVIASPLFRSWRYRISAVNTCGVEGPLSNNHKTLHLNTINQITPGVIDIYWDDYEGISTGVYTVYRYTDQDNWQALSPTIPFGNTTIFTDTPPVGATGLDYFVDFELATPCTATYRAQDFNRTRSNKERGVFNPGEGSGGYSNNEVATLIAGNSTLVVYPNPFENELKINLSGSSNSVVQILDLQGKEILSINCIEGENILHTNFLESGIYFVKAQLNGEIRTVKITK